MKTFSSMSKDTKMDCKAMVKVLRIYSVPKERRRELVEEYVSRIKMYDIMLISALIVLSLVFVCDYIINHIVGRI